MCLVTKALHLELVSDLSTANFVQAFERFLSRRGVCSVMYWDFGISMKYIFSTEFVETITIELSTTDI